jgi:hypothetical protein
MSTPNTGIPYVPEGTLDLSAAINHGLDVIDALLQTAVLDMALTAPPGSPADGDLYIPAAPATGAWVNQENNLARYVAEGTFWQFYTAGTQVRLVLNRADGGLYWFNVGVSPGAWELLVAAGGLTVQDDDSPPSIVVNGTALLIVGDGLVLEEVAPGVARISLAP